MRDSACKGCVYFKTSVVKYYGRLRFTQIVRSEIYKKKSGKLSRTSYVFFYTFV